MSTPPWLQRPSARRRRARIHLPPLTGEQALALVALLDRAIAAIWRAHGDDMADRLAMLGAQMPAQSPDDITGEAGIPDNIDF